MTKREYISPRSEAIAFHTEALLGNTSPCLTVESDDVDECDKTSRQSWQEEDESFWDD